MRSMTYLPNCRLICGTPQQSPFDLCASLSELRLRLPESPRIIYLLKTTLRNDEGLGGKKIYVHRNLRYSAPAY